MNTPRDLSIPIDRITWRDGQKLASRDLRDSQANGDRLRHLHIHYQHKTWGVVEGLQVGASGTGAVEVSPGYALDIDGHELLVPLGTVVPVPASGAASTTLYLVISAGAVSGCCCDASPAPDLATLCPGAGNAVELEGGVLSWKTVKEVRPGADVLLARALVTNGALASAIDTSNQRRARTMTGGRIWSEVTQAGQTVWTDGSEVALRNIIANIDTSDAGFVLTPAYFAWLAGTNNLMQGFITAAGASSFTFVLRPDVPVPGGGWTAATANSQGWTVQWFAVELPPPLLLFPFVTI